MTVHVGVRYAHVRKFGALVQIGVLKSEDVHGALVGGGAQKFAVQTEVQTVECGRINAASQFDDLRLTQCVEHSNERAFLRGGRHQSAVDVQRDAGQFGLVSVDTDRRGRGVRSNGVHIVNHHRAGSMARTNDHLPFGRVQWTDLQNTLTIVARIETEELFAFARKGERVYHMLLGDKNPEVAVSGKRG